MTAVAPTGAFFSPKGGVSPVRIHSQWLSSPVTH